MGRPKRAAKGGLIYHVLNRANARMTILEKDEDLSQFTAGWPGLERGRIKGEEIE